VRSQRKQTGGSVAPRIFPIDVRVVTATNRNLKDQEDRRRKPRT